MAEKNVILKDGEDILYPKTLLSLVDGMPQPTSADNGKMLGVDDGAYALVEGGGGGGSLYQHNVAFSVSQSGAKGYAIITFLNDSATPMATISDIKSALIDEGFESGSNIALKPCGGKIADTNVFGCNVYDDLFRLFYLMQGSPYERYPAATVINTIIDVVDTIVQI